MKDTKPLNLDKVARRTQRIIGSGYALIVALVGFISFFSLMRLEQAHDATSNIIDNEQVAVEMLFHMQQAARDRAILLYRLISTEDAFKRDEMILQHQALGAKFGEARRSLNQLHMDPPETVLLEQLSALAAHANELQLRIFEQVHDGNLRTAQELLSKQALPAQDQLLDAINILLEHEIAEARDQADNARVKRRNTNILLFSSAAGGIVLVGLIALWLSRRVRALINNLSISNQDLLVANNELSALKQALDYHDIASITDVQGKIIYANDKFCQISQYSREEILGQNHRLLKSGVHPDSLYEDMWDTISRGKVWQGEICNRKKDGSVYWVYSTIMPLLDENGLPYRYISLRTDITQIKEAQQVLKRSHAELEALVEARTADLKDREAMLEQLATTDALTCTFNRRYFNDLLEMEIARHQRYRSPLSLILFDVDHFKHVNDAYGHLVGDKVLQQLSSLISENIRTNDVFARWGGEEFTILTSACNLSCAHQLAEKLRSAIERFEFAEVGHVTCSFGVAEFMSGDTQDTLVKRADLCLYAAKASGRNRVNSA